MQIVKGLIINQLLFEYATQVTNSEKLGRLLSELGMQKKL